MKTTYKKEQIGYIAQELKKVYSEVKNRELTEKEINFIDELGFYLALDYKIDRDKILIDYLKDLDNERKQAKIKELEKELNKIKGE